MAPLTGDEQQILVVFDNAVYDVSKFAKRHPGGSFFIVDNNRKDITQSFNEAGHSQKARKVLSNLYVCPVSEWKDSDTGEPFFPSVKAVDTDPVPEGDSKYKYKESSHFHQTRRKEILAKYPEVETLFGPSFIPLIYGFLCAIGFIYVGFLVGQNQGHGISSWYFPLLMSWTILPILSFGLNNVNHEICHGNTRIISLSSPIEDTTKEEHWCLDIITKAVLLFNGIVALNHFQFYYYSTSHKSHHGALGNQTDRGHAFRTLYFSFFQTKAGNIPQMVSYM